MAAVAGRREAKTSSVNSSQAEELCAFIRDKLGFSFADAGEGWLIFNLPEADMGCHPADPADGEPAGTHKISFYGEDMA